MLAGLTPNYKQSTTTLKYYIEKYYYTGSIIYMYTLFYIDVFTHIPGSLA